MAAQCNVSIMGFKAELPIIPKILRNVSFLMTGVMIMGLVPLTSAVAETSYTWTEQTTAGTREWQQITSSADGLKLATTVFDGSIWTSDDAGATWNERTAAGTREWRPIASSADGTKLAAASLIGSNIWTSSDSGVTWTERTGSGSRAWRSIAMSADGTKLAAVTSSGSIWTSTNSGVTWSQQTGAGNVQYITSSADGMNLAAVSSSGGVWTSDDSGITWTQRTIATGLHSWHSLASSTDGSKLAVGEYGGSIWTSADRGVTWTERTAAGSGKWQSIASSADGTIIAAVDTGGSNHVAVSTDSGATWTAQTGAGTRTWWHITMNSDGSRIAATDDGGSIWTAHIPDDPPSDPPANTTLVNLHNAVNAAPVSIATPDSTNITCSSALTESDLATQDPGYMYPLGLVRFCFTTPNTSNQVTVTFATDLKPSDISIRHYNTLNNTYTSLTDVTITQTTLDGQAALQIIYTIVDNGPLDEDPVVGSITDPIGIAAMVGAPNTGIGPSATRQPK